VQNIGAPVVRPVLATRRKRMKHASWKFLVMAGATIGFVACKDTLTPSVVTDAQLQSDVAASTGDAISNEVLNLIGNEATAALPSSQPSFNVFATPMASETVTVVRSRTCLDASSAVIACANVANVRKVITHFSVDGSRIGIYFAGFVHRVADDTTTRNFVSTTEVSRTHTAIIASHDTTTFQDPTASGLHYENASDSVNAVTWNIPRETNPFPISGSIVRNVAVHASYTKNSNTMTRDFTKRVEVDFPADAQGNVVLKIDATTCNLNLVTHAVTGCH
jgi:hypothetical protein